MSGSLASNQVDHSINFCLECPTKWCGGVDHRQHQLTDDGSLSSSASAFFDDERLWYGDD